MVISVNFGANENDLDREMYLYYFPRWEYLTRELNSDKLTASSKNVIKPGWRKARKGQ